MVIIILTKCVYDLKCPFNTISLDRNDPFNLLPSARSYDVNRWHGKFLYIVLVNTRLVALIQE